MCGGCVSVCEWFCEGGVRVTLCVAECVTV